MSSSRCIIPAPSLSEGERVGAKEANTIFCATTPPTTGPAPIPLLPKFTTAGAYLAYKRACNARTATTFHCASGTINNVTINLSSGPFDPPYNEYQWLAQVLWSPVGGISSYIVSLKSSQTHSKLLVCAVGLRLLSARSIYGVSSRRPLLLSQRPACVPKSK